VIDAYRLGARAAEQLGTTLAYDQRIREIAGSGDAFTRKALALVGVRVDEKRGCRPAPRPNGKTERRP
jgi:hypothetical protein